MNPKQSQPQSRLLSAFSFFLAILLFFLWQLFDLQVVNGAEYFAQSQRKIAKYETVEAARGEIVDRYGQPLAVSSVSWQLSLDTNLMGEARDETLQTLTELCLRDGIPWNDSLPISPESPYVYTKEERSESDTRRFSALLKAIKLSEPSQASELLSELSEHYKLPKDLSPQTRRNLCGILYELELRRRELSVTSYVFAEGVSVDFITKIKEHNLPGISISAGAMRTYKTPAAAHLLGRVGQMNEEEWELFKPKGYSMDARIGKDGLERAFEDDLHGSPGARTRDYDTEGNLINEVYSKEPVPGKQVRLTLDLGLQEKTEQVLAEQVPRLPHAEGAAVAILDVRDGSVLALASYPSFSLGSFSSDFQSLQDNPLRPLLNRALQGLYAPGSTYKMVTAVAGLEEGIITPNTKILDTGIYTYYKSPQPRCWLYRQTGKTHGLETVSEAITDSCNVFFYDVGRRLGIERVDKYATLFGLGELTGIELPGEMCGIIAGPAYTQSLGQTWYDGSTLSAAIGQENNRFTPLQLASYVATLANGGQRHRVHLLKELRSNDGRELLKETQAELVDTISLTQENLNAVKEGMLAVTQTGSVASYFRTCPVRVAAKTGSAQVTGSEDSNAVFVCFAPYENPEIAMAIVVEKGGSGSELGRISSEIMNYYFHGPEAAEASHVTSPESPIPQEEAP